MFNDHWKIKMEEQVNDDQFEAADYLRAICILIYYQQLDVISCSLMGFPEVNNP